jgi:ribosomal-protein-alanine N-acetyltransferase
MVFETPRLIIRKATTSDKDVEWFFGLWTNPKVMTMVGYPHGLLITREEIKDNIGKEDDTEYNKKLVVEMKETHQLIGECKLGLPDEEGISETDVKLLPEFWGNGYGTEIKQGLVNYLFEHTDCSAVQGTPNQKNIASRKMQEAVGARKIDEGVFRFPEKMKSYTCDVPYFKYRVYREDWERR